MRIKVTVKPDARKETFVSVGQHSFVATIKEPAERNAANTRVRELLSLHYKVPTKAVRMVTGHTSPRKTFDIAQP